MSILVNQFTKVIRQGFIGSQGTSADITVVRG